MRTSSLFGFTRMPWVSVLVATVSIACSTGATTDAPLAGDATDRGSLADSTSADRVVPADARTDAPTADTPASMDVMPTSDVPVVTDAMAMDSPAATDVPAFDVTMGRDVPSRTDVTTGFDVPSRVDAATDCTLPSGGTCARGSSCPAGDGCNTCFCPLTGSALCTTRPCAADAGSSDVIFTRDVGTPPTDASTTAECRSDTDCRLFSSYCASAPCQCFALSPTDPTPRCMGGMVTCFIDPCARRTASCSGGMCVVTP